MTDTRNFRLNVVRPTLQNLGLWSEAAEELLMGTAAVESGFRFRRQIGGGPALGLFQMESCTHDDIWINYLGYRPELARRIWAVSGNGPGMNAREMVHNDIYACAMARIHYLRVREPLPVATNPKELGQYWKRHYNTRLGAGTVEKFVEAYSRIDMASPKPEPVMSDRGAKATGAAQAGAAIGTGGALMAASQTLGIASQASYLSPVAIGLSVVAALLYGFLFHTRRGKRLWRRFIGEPS